jgi:hypothetical protein
MGRKNTNRKSKLSSGYGQFMGFNRVWKYKKSKICLFLPAKTTIESGAVFFIRSRLLLSMLILLTRCLSILPMMKLWVPG